MLDKQLNSCWSAQLLTVHVCTTMRSVFFYALWIMIGQVQCMCQERAFVSFLPWSYTYLRAKKADNPWKWAKYYKSSSSNLNMIDIKNTGAFIKQSNDKYFMGTYRVLRRCKLNEIKSQRRKLAQIRCRQQSNSWREEVGAASLKEE